MASVSAPSMQSGLDSLFDKLNWSPEEEDEFRKLLRKGSKEEVNIVLCGKTGAGKSTLINALVGVEKAAVGKTVRPETSVITKYTAQTDDNFTINVWDTPGLRDGSGREEDYLRDLRTTVYTRDIDMMIYCIDMSQMRSDLEHPSSPLKLLTRALGVEMWKHSMVILTHANIVASRFEKKGEEQAKYLFQGRLREWKEKVRTALCQAGVPEGVVSSVPVEPAGRIKIHYLPDRIHWLGYLWLVFLSQVKKEAKLAVLILNQNRIISTEYLIPEGVEAPLVVNSQHVVSLLRGIVAKTIDKLLKRHHKKKKS